MTHEDHQHKTGGEMRYNDVYFGFALTPSQAEGLYRTLNGILNDMDPDDPNLEATIALRDRVLDFTRKHPCRYGAEAL